MNQIALLYGVYYLVKDATSGGNLVAIAVQYVSTVKLVPLLHVVNHLHNLLAKFVCFSHTMRFAIYADDWLSV